MLHTKLPLNTQRSSKRRTHLPFAFISTRTNEEKIIEKGAEIIVSNRGQTLLTSSGQAAFIANWTLGLRKVNPYSRTDCIFMKFIGSSGFLEAISRGIAGIAHVLLPISIGNPSRRNLLLTEPQNRNPFGLSL